MIGPKNGFIDNCIWCCCCNSKIQRNQKLYYKMKSYKKAFKQLV